MISHAVFFTTNGKLRGRIQGGFHGREKEIEGGFCVGVGCWTGIGVGGVSEGNTGGRVDGRSTFF